MRARNSTEDFLSVQYAVYIQEKSLDGRVYVTSLSQVIFEKHVAQILKESKSPRQKY